jgi:4-hydroxy-4-methyl-2-oxoglutarate aldolase
VAVVLSEAQLDALRSVDTPTICNAIEAFKVRDQTYGYTGVDVRCLFPDLGVMVGYAVTARVSSTEPGTPDQHDSALKLWETLAAAPKPAVLVFEDVGPRTRQSAHFGEMMGNTSTRLGAIGLVTDGGVRDLNEVRGLGFTTSRPARAPRTATRASTTSAGRCTWTAAVSRWATSSTAT